MFIYAVAVAAGGDGVASAQTLAPEVRGTWLTTTGPDHISSGFNTESIVAQLRTTGLNTLYSEAWKNGYTQFASPTLDGLIGRDRSPSLGSRDILTETSIQAHRHGMVNLAWFEYGFSPQFLGSGGTPSNPMAVAARSRGWLLQDQNGNYANASNAFAWMNPALPAVREFLIDLTLDAVRSHDLDGIQFDDRLAWPREFGWDDTTAVIYQSETGRNLPTNVNDADFRAWRQSKVTQFAGELYAAVKAERPDLIVSVSPSVAGFSDVNFNAAWGDWVEQGLFDEFVPQVYRGDLNSFRATLPSNVQPFVDAGREDDLIVGLRYNGSGTNTPTNVLLQQIVDVALAENGALAGHSLWYSDQTINNSGTLENFYGNQRDHPAFGPDWRPPPVVAVSSSDNTWSVEVDAAEQYRVVAEVFGRWIEVESAFFDAGVHSLTVPNATEVELLLDRRPLPGDTNYDRIVSDLDLLTLVNHFGQAGGREQGDFTGDGRVDFLDAEVLVEYWQRGVAPGSALPLSDALIRLVPEPASAVVWMVGGWVVMVRRRSSRA
ncbi:MAG: family 10 glycosylhydrolase [Planctomycetota bacterium]